MFSELCEWQTHLVPYRLLRLHNVVLTLPADLLNGLRGDCYELEILNVWGIVLLYKELSRVQRKYSVIGFSSLYCERATSQKKGYVGIHRLAFYQMLVAASLNVL